MSTTVSYVVTIRSDERDTVQPNEVERAIELWMREYCQLYYEPTIAAVKTGEYRD